MAAGWTCLFLLLTAIAATLGGLMGAPRQRTTVRPAQTDVRYSNVPT